MTAPVFRTGWAELDDVLATFGGDDWGCSVGTQSEGPARGGGFVQRSVTIHLWLTAATDERQARRRLTDVAADVAEKLLEIPGASEYMVEHAGSCRYWSVEVSPFMADMSRVKVGFIVPVTVTS